MINPSKGPQTTMTFLPHNTFSIYHAIQLIMSLSLLFPLRTHHPGNWSLSTPSVAAMLTAFWFPYCQVSSKGQKEVRGRWKSVFRLLITLSHTQHTQLPPCDSSCDLQAEVTAPVGQPSGAHTLSGF